jgi:uncharacterized membrane protein YfcA
MDAAGVVLLALIFLIAVLYSSVGQAGGSGYLAAMALMGMAPAAMKPTALCLNIVVALIATTRFARAGHFDWRLYWPFALGSVPFAFIGGVLALPSPIYKGVVGMLLLFAAGMLLLRADRQQIVSGQADAQTVSEGGPLAATRDDPQKRGEIGRRTADCFKPQPSVPAGLSTGCVIGLVSGMIGIGGGIFLSPVVMLRGWAGARETAAVAAPFILVNSIVALAGHYLSTGYIPAPAPLWAVAAALGGVIGAGMGARRLSAAAIRRVLAVILLVAAVRLILSM